MGRGRGRASRVSCLVGPSCGGSINGALSEEEAFAITCALAPPTVLRLVGGGSKTQSSVAFGSEASTRVPSSAGDSEAEPASDDEGDGVDVGPERSAGALWQGGRQPKGERTGWVVASGNTTSFSSAKGVLESRRYDAMLLQETKLGSDEAVANAVQWCRSRSWKLAASRALRGQRGRPSAGTGVATRSYLGVDLWPDMYLSELVPGRATGVRVRGMTAGGVCLGSVYLKVGAGMAGENAAVLDVLAGRLRSLEYLWILGGDWNNAPEDLVE